MSDPVTNVEIEDVLSSIRRLVTDDSRVKQVERPQPDRLVLTPAQRVPDDTEAERAERQPPLVLRATPADGGQGSAPDSGSGAGETPLQAPRETALGRMIGAEVARALDAEFGDEAEESPEPFPMTAKSRDAAEQDGAVMPSSAPESAGGIDDNTARPRAGETTLERKIAELEAIIARSSERFEPEAAEEEAPTATFIHRKPDPVDWEEQLPGVAEPSRQGSGAGQEGSGTAEAVPAALDDAALRGMVAEIVRQELQGSLGERITRNVRKLVRREIHRILMSQEFE